MNISPAGRLSTEQVMAFIAQLQERIRILKDETTRLKKLNTKPSDKNGDGNNGNYPGHDDEPGREPESSDTGLSDRKGDVDKPNNHTKRKNTKPDKPQVTEESVITTDSIPEGSTRHGREAFYVQELEIHSKTICYWLEKWLTPEFKVVIGRQPDTLSSYHFEPQVRAFIIAPAFRLWRNAAPVIGISLGYWCIYLGRGTQQPDHQRALLVSSGKGQITCDRYSLFQLPANRRHRSQ